mgnify:CR=1 FL=1
MRPALRPTDDVAAVPAADLAVQLQRSGEAAKTSSVEWRRNQLTSGVDTQAPSPFRGLNHLSLGNRARALQRAHDGAEGAATQKAFTVFEEAFGLDPWRCTAIKD